MLWTAGALLNPTRLGTESSYIPQHKALAKLTLRVVHGIFCASNSSFLDDLSCGHVNAALGTCQQASLQDRVY